ncbi:MAG: response regulator [Candidatus Hodarchaeota archaeon]
MYLGCFVEEFEVRGLKMKKKIIIVEDDPKDQKLFKLLMERFPNTETKYSSNGDEALELIKKEKPNLAILDIHLPGKSGLEICKEIKESEDLKDILTLAISAFDMENYKKVLSDAGFDKFIGKPLRIQEFIKVVRQLLS